MISEMAIEDCEVLAERGVKLTPRDIVRLNGLGLKVERSKRCAEVYTLPRFAVLGKNSVILREPSIAAEMWLSECAEIFDFGDGDTFLALRAFSMSVDELPPFGNAKTIRKAVKDFCKKKLPDVTRRQLRAACDYVVNGADPATGEYPPPKDELAEAPESPGEYSFDVGVLREGVAVGLGSFEDLKKRTASEVQMMSLYRLEIEGRIKLTDDEYKRRIGEYYAAKSEIEKRVNLVAVNDMAVETDYGKH